jgi:hypothetical protein
MGPVPANEWQWYNWKGSTVDYNGTRYGWLEYFILRIAEEQQASGIKLLDVLDIHFYPGETQSSDIVQLHRVFFDTTYNYPGANGLKRPVQEDGTTALPKNIFSNANTWLTKYMGATMCYAVSIETGINGDNPNVTASWYASTLGNSETGVRSYSMELKTGDEVIHLFSRYGRITLSLLCLAGTVCLCLSHHQ